MAWRPLRVHALILIVAVESIESIEYTGTPERLRPSGLLWLFGVDREKK